MIVKALPCEYNFARMIVEDSMSVTESYIIAYMDESTPERAESNYTRAEISNRASKAYKTEKVQKIVKALRHNIELELGRNMVWDKVKSAETLKKIIERNEASMKTLDDMNKNGVKDDKSFSQMLRLSTQISQSTIEANCELNKLFGVYDTKTEYEKKAQIDFELDMECTSVDAEDEREQAEINYYGCTKSKRTTSKTHYEDEIKLAELQSAKPLLKYY